MRTGQAASTTIDERRSHPPCAAKKNQHYLFLQVRFSVFCLGSDVVKDWLLGITMLLFANACCLQVNIQRREEIYKDRDKYKEKRKYKERVRYQQKGHPHLAGTPTPPPPAL